MKTFQKKSTCCLRLHNLKHKIISALSICSGQILWELLCLLFVPSCDYDFNIKNVTGKIWFLIKGKQI